MKDFTMKTVAYVKVKLKPGERSRPIIAWCELNIGSYSKWNFTFAPDLEMIFEFAREKDATFFALQWAR